MDETGSIETNQYLTFKLDNEVFGLAIDKVREVLDFTTITRVPQTPAYMRGVINLRGSVVPVIDLHQKFGLSQTEQTVNTCIVIVETMMEDEITILGALADSVQEVLNIEPDQIEPAPKIGTKLKTEFIRGMGKTNDKFIILLDVDKVFANAEMTSVMDIGRETVEA